MTSAELWVKIPGVTAAPKGGVTSAARPPPPAPSPAQCAANRPEHTLRKRPCGWAAAMPRDMTATGRYPPQPKHKPIAFYSAVRLGNPGFLAEVMATDPYYVTQDNGAGAPMHFATTYRQLDMARPARATGRSPAHALAWSCGATSRARSESEVVVVVHATDPSPAEERRRDQPEG